MSWLDELESELRAVGLPPARRRRIVAELGDHLSEDPDAGGRLGSPEALARQFVDELGTARVRRAAISAFLALVPLGALFALFFAPAAVRSTQASTSLTLCLVLGVQLAFVGGTLGLLRALRLRRAAVIPRAEAKVLLNRAALGIAGGALTVAALAAVSSPRWLGGALPWVTIGVGAACVLVAAVILVQAAQFVPRMDGAPRDLSFDLGLGMDPWRLALVIAGGVALCIVLAGIAQADPIDGLVRAIGDGLLCLAGFALLGRPLGLRS